ncbi:MAG: hypothetical protein K2M62_07600, partial [Muribaculaceae bacterium]|nr:hypothetical protein [Muribaculaceae bacterium]
MRRIPLLSELTSIIIFTLSLLGCTGCRHTVSGADPELERLRSQAMNHIDRRQFTEADSLGLLLEQKATRIGNDTYRLYGVLCRSFYPYISNSDYSDRRSRLQAARKEAEILGNDTLSASIEVALGGYALFNDGDYPAALTHFDKALHLTQNMDGEQFRMVSQANLSELFFQSGDTLGIGYDREIYSYALRHDDIHLLQTSVSHMVPYL